MRIAYKDLGEGHEQDEEALPANHGMASIEPFAGKPATDFAINDVELCRLG